MKKILSEKEIILTMNSHLTEKSERELFSTDAESFLIGSTPMLFSTDTFSGEDLFDASNPYDLGWNVALGTITDILASGGRPLFYSHSVTIPPEWELATIKQFSRGIKKILETFSVKFLSGDLSRGKEWQYTGSVIGKRIGNKIDRSTAKCGDKIYLTGTVGKGAILASQTQLPNLFKKIPKAGFTRFIPRVEEAKIIAQFARSATDTSDGVFQALRGIASSSQLGFQISNLPFESVGKFLELGTGFPIEFLFLLECGEYELLFTVSEEDEKKMLKLANEKGLTLYPIGEMLSDPSVQIYRSKKGTHQLSRIHCSARSFSSIKEYLKSLKLSWEDSRVS